MLSLFVVTEETADEDGFTFESIFKREGKARKNQAPDFFHN
jgi:hypothetical protein